MAVIIDGTNGITSPGETLTGTQVLAAGTTSIAPLDFTSGTLLTTPLAGAMEYDGKVIYATPQSTQRGVVPGAQFFRLNAGLAGANATGAQNALGVGVALSASTVYEFEAVMVFAKTAGTTSHTFAFGMGGTATVNNVLGQLSASEISGTLGANAVNIWSTAFNSVTSAVVSGAMTAATKTMVLRVAGTISINAGGTLTPQYTLSAAPGGAYTTQAGSYFLIYPIGASGANTSVGTWA
jgi:hypothetical protein